MKWNHFQNITADNQVRTGGVGAIEAIVSAMKTHKDNAGVCKQGCWALWNITVNGTFYFASLEFVITSLYFIAGNRTRLKGLNATDAIKAVQDRHPDLSDKIKTILERISN